MRRPHNGNHHRPVGPPAHRPAAPPRRSAPASRRAPTDNCSPAEPFSRTRREPHPRTPGWTVPGRILGGGPVMTPSATPPQQPPAAAGTAAALPHRGHPVRGGRATGAERSRTPPRRPGHRVTTDISTATTGGAGRRVTGRTAREVDDRTTRPRRGHRRWTSSAHRMREPLVASLPVCGDHDAQDRDAAERSAAQSVAAARQPVTCSPGDLLKNTKATVPHHSE